jgi:hypothetical protein
MSRVDLERIHQWATAKLSAGQALGRAEHQYLVLCDTVEGMLTKMNSGAAQLDNSPTETPRRKAHLRLVWAKYSPTPLHGAERPL